MHDDVARFLNKLAPRRGEIELVPPRQHPQGLLERRPARARPGGERAVLERPRRIRRHQRRIDLVARADAAALRTGAVGVVEGEHARRHLGEGDTAGRAGETLREDIGRSVRHFDLDHALGQTQRRLEGVVEAGAQRVADDEPVHHHLDGVLLGLGELDLLGQLLELAIHAHPHIALAAKIEEELAILPLASAHHGGEDDEPAARGQGHDAVHHLLHGLGGDDRAAARAMGHADPREEHAQVVVDLGHRAHRRARVLRRRLLLDRDGGGQPLDGVDVGLLHLLEELPGIGGQRLDVAPLTFGIDGVEGERRLAGAGETGEDHQLVPRDLEVYGLEVVLTRAADDDPVIGHRSPF